MKRNLVLEYRIRKLEKLILLEDIESDLDDMSNNIIKNNPTVDLDDSLNDDSNEIINKDRRFKYDTVDEFIDDIIYDFGKRLNHDAESEIKLLLKDLNGFNSFKSVRYTNILKNSIKEISDMSYFKAKKYITNAANYRLNTLSSNKNEPVYMTRDDMLNYQSCIYVSNMIKEIDKQHLHMCDDEPITSEHIYILKRAYNKLKKSNNDRYKSTIELAKGLLNKYAKNFNVII